MQQSLESKLAVKSTCPNCRADLNPGKNFCPKCGQQVSTLSDSAVPETGDVSLKKPPLKVEQNHLTNSVTLSHPESKNKKLTWLIVSAISVLVVIAAVGVWAYSQGYFMDNESPQVTITSPAYDKTLNLTSENRVEEVIEIKATDNRKIKKVILYINDAVVKEFNEGNSYLYKWEADNAGSYNIKADVFDNKGNKATSKTIKINVLNNSSNNSSSNNSSNNPSQTNEITNIKATITSHYMNIPSNLALAHDSFSNKLQQQQPKENWIKSFSSTISDSVDKVNVINVNENEALASFAMTSRDRSDGGKTIVRKWEGQWKLVKENEQWKLDEPQIKMVSENYE